MATAAGTLTQPSTTTTETTLSTRLERRLDEHDADYVRLHAATVARLSASIARYVRELRASGHDAQRQSAAASRFVARHTGLLREAYHAGWREGQRDYAGEVSNQRDPVTTAKPTDEHVGHRLRFYAPSVAKMAAEGLRAAHQASQMASSRLAERAVGTIHLVGGHEPGYSQNRDDHGRWAPGDGGRQEARDGAGGTVSVQRETRGYHLRHTAVGGEVLHEEHVSSLAKIHSYAKSHGISQRLTLAHFAAAAAGGATSGEGEGG